MSLESKHISKALKAMPRTARSVALSGVAVTVAAFLFPAKLWLADLGHPSLLAPGSPAYDPLALGWWGLVVSLVAIGGVGLGVAWTVFAFWQAAAGIAESAQFVPRRVAFRFMHCLPYLLVPLAAVCARTAGGAVAGWLRRHWAAAVLANDTWSPHWQTAEVLWPLAPPLLMVVSVSAAIGLLWWSRIERFAGTPYDELYGRAIPPRVTGFTAAALLSGGFLGCKLASRLFGNPRRGGWLHAWLVMVTIGGAAIWAAIHFDPFQWRDHPGFYQETELALDRLDVAWGREKLGKQLMMMVDSSDEKLRERGLFGLSYLGVASRSSFPRLFAEVHRAEPVEQHRLIRLLDSIDPHWPTTSGADELLPDLCALLANLAWVDAAWPPNLPWPPTPPAEGPVAIRRLLGEKTHLDLPPLQYRGDYLLNETAEGLGALRLIQVLNEISPQWPSSVSGRRAIRELRSVWEDQNHPQFDVPGWWHAADAILRRVDPTWSADRERLAVSDSQQP